MRSSGCNGRLGGNWGNPRCVLASSPNPEPSVPPPDVDCRFPTHAQISVLAAGNVAESKPFAMSHSPRTISWSAMGAAMSRA
jgi:hypothetical protein